MNPGTAIACRTRYRRRKLFEDALIMSRKKKKARERESISSKGEDGSGKMEPVSPFSVGLSMNSERVSSESGFQPLGGHENDPIEISDGDNGSETEEGLRESENDIFCVEVEKKSEEDEGSFVLGDKVVNFDDDNCGCVSDKPDVLTIDDDEEDDLLSSSTDSEDKETSDEDFLVADDDDGFETEGSTTSDESNGDDGRGGDDVRGVQRKILKGMVRKMESDAESSEIRERKGERKGNEQVDVEELWRMADCTSATSSKSEIYKKEGQHVAHKDEEKRVQSVIADSEVFGVHVKNSGCSMSSEALEHMKKSDSATLQKQIGDPAVVEKSGRNKNINVDLVDIDDIKRKGNQQNKGTGLRSVSFRPKNQAKIGDSAKIVMEKDKEGEPKYWFHSNNRKKDGDGAVDDETGDKELYEVTRMPSTLKNKCYQIFTECFMGKNDSVKDNSYKLDEKDDVVAEGETQALVSREPTPLNCSFMNEEEPVEKSEEDELDMLWAEMDMLLRAEEIGTQVNNMGTNEATENGESSAPKCKHDTIFNEQIGIYCRWCGWTVTEIKYITPPFVDSERYGGRMASSSEGKTSLLDGAMLNESGDDDSEVIWSQKEGTVWDLIPDIKQSLYPHQQEGFEFIWRNLAGTIDLAKLKSVDPCNEGGCIISHAPGTGKTRLTMVFLQSYLQLFPKCLPVIIAPSSILLTWEDELRKWKLGIPFHNLNSAELSGNEQLISEVDWYGNQRQNKDAIRMVKLCSWYKEKSILLISYNLYEKLAGATSVGGGGKDKNNKKFGKKKRAKTREYIESGMGKVLRDYPGLLVLDEGHTPRNQNSYIWKVLSESRTQKRILLSGTPFQNNFLELYNILCLMKPSFPDSIPQELKKFCQSRLMQGGKASKEMNWEHVSSGNPADVKINQLKLLMNPFVHVHKGSILEKNLPGLRECVLVLKPDILQQETLESIECSQNVLNFEHKLALVSVHPSLFLSCSLSEKEESIIDKDRLEKIRLNPYAGVKTKFLIEFIRLCDAVNEKVLVFSQFIDTLDLIKEQLESALNWTVGMEVLYMYGRLDQKQKQSLIYSFNDANSRAKVLLASIKASSEGINLVGASRVVLLDVVWNPSVERQAICRAYRLGQKKVVFTYHLLAQDTPECTKYCKQAEKNRLSELVFSNKNAESDKLKSSGVMLEDFEDRVLDVMVQHEKLKDMIGECLIQPRKRDLEILGP
ncbi:SNF2 domain-containing protein CLASSY 4-like [Vigna unguiculata]|uniref:SNF2 domain-containing protein CLASSY 4-like n=1 Tax=Vigna unguiculata TaxID=3917 RepID=UPI001016F724|nr:SNF2 domain-containing protein CLASSY 4-like [Vigna unguiculata]